MRTIYVPHSQKAWENFFKVQSGHGLLGYRGSTYQRGSGIGSLLGGLLKSFMPVAKTIGKTVGKQALRTGAEVAADALSGVDIGESLKQRGKIGASKLIAKGVRKLDSKKKTLPKRKKARKQQKGRGLGKRPKTKSTTAPVKRTRRASRSKRMHADQLGLYIA